jgi:hypothetical protein
MNGVPSHVGDFKFGSAKANDVALEEAKAGDSWGFFAAFKEGLIAKADTEEGAVGLCPFFEGWDETCAVEVFHAVAKGSDSWQDESLAVGEIVGGEDFFVGRVEIGEGFFYASEVAHAVVDDSDHGV